MNKTYGIQTINDLDFCKEALVEAQAGLLTDGIPIAVLCVWRIDRWHSDRCTLCVAKKSLEWPQQT